MLWPLVAISTGLTVLLSFIFAYMNIEKIKGDWKNQRCNPLIIASAYLYKPDDDPRTSGEFAEENFTFCAKHLVDDVLAVAFKPIGEAIRLQLGTASSVMDVSNIYRQLLTNLKNTFDSVILQFYKTFWIGFLQFRRVFDRILDIYKRISGVIVASLYFGLTLITAFMNIFDVIKIVVIIIMSILIALFILLFIPLAPIIGVLIAVVAIMASVGIAIPGGDIFCFGPDTLVIKEDGSLVPIKDIKVGDRLAHDCGEVEGIMKMDGQQERLWSLDGILVSGAHIIWNGSKWVHVATSGLAHQTIISLPRLYILNTSTSRIPIMSPAGYTFFAKDWEELSPDDIYGAAIWDWLVDLTINEDGAGAGAIFERELPSEVPLIEADAGFVKRILSSGYTPIGDIQLGDVIWDGHSKTYTRVLAIYKGQLKHAGLSDGSWVWSDDHWAHPVSSLELPASTDGVQLVTSAGSFTCWLGLGEGQQAQEVCIRDFSEIGIQQIHKTYPFILERINYPGFQ